jgi:RNA polymerase sigma-70 factor (ECF subfamily)
VFSTGIASKRHWRIRRRDAAPGQWRPAIRRRHRYLRNLLRRLCRDAALADDLAQQAIVQAWRSISGLRAPLAFGGWLRTLAVNTWLQHVRVHDSRALEPLAEEDPADHGAHSTVAERLDLDAALALLAPAVRLCVVLAYQEGLSHGEISSATGLPIGTVKSHINRGAARLREALKDYRSDS